MSVVKEADCLCVRYVCACLYSWSRRFSLTGLALNPHRVRISHHRLLKRLLNRALLGNGTFSAFTPHPGQRTRYHSITTVVRYSDHARSRTSRS